MIDYFKFIIEKSKVYSLSVILRLEFESFIFGVFSLVPTTIGIVFRGILAKLMLKKLNGFPWIQPRCTIVHSERLTVGTHFGVNSGTYINALGGINIGNHVLIGSNVTISSGMHPIDGVSPIFLRHSTPKKITINDDVWIGAGAVIMPGVTLGKGTVIGANSVVTRDTEEYSICVGAPARKIRNRLS